MKLGSCYKQPKHNNLGACSIQCWTLCPGVVSQQLHSSYRKVHQRHTTYSNWLPASHSNGWPALAGIEPEDLQQKRKKSDGDNCISLCWETEPLLHDRLHFRLTEQQKFLNQEDHMCLLCLSSCKTSQKKVQLQINGLTTNRSANGRKFHPNLAVTPKVQHHNPPGMKLPRPTWLKLNRLRTGVDLFWETMYKWGMPFTPTCECCAKEQSANHIITSCPIHLMIKLRHGYLNDVPASEVTH